MDLPLEKPLFILEMANNHMGSVEHGLRIVRDFYEVTKDFDFNFAFKLQFRDLDTFIHPDFRNRTDIKYIKRFLETRLSKEEFKYLKEEIKATGYLSMCTPFDEPSVDLLDELDFDLIKVGSCSFTDWPLLERIAQSRKAVILSTAGASVADLDRVVGFFKHRNKSIALMHCVGEYPTPHEQYELNQIDFLRERYHGIPIGLSTHESPEEYRSIMLAIAKGACIFEKHVGVPTDTIKLNAYSCSPTQLKRCLNSAQAAYQMCGAIKGRKEFSSNELETLRSLARAAYAKKALQPGQKICLSDVFFAIPARPDQALARDFSKYAHFTAVKEIPAQAPILVSQVEIKDTRATILEIVKRSRQFLSQARLPVSGEAQFEISHHYGLEHFFEYGIVMITVVNRGYCKKLIIVFPGQQHPEQYHSVKEESFHILYGDVILTLNGEDKHCKAGDVVIVEAGVRHAFRSTTGAVIEEISSTHLAQDSFYTDTHIAANKNRKTLVTHWISDETEV